MCTEMKARDPGLLADELFLLMEGAQFSIQILGARGPAAKVARAADVLIDAQWARWVCVSTPSANQVIQRSYQ